MNFELSSEDQEIRQWARRFAQEVLAPEAEKNSRQKISRSLLERLASEKFTVLSISETQGGLGLSTLQFSLVIRELSKVCGSTGVTVAVTNMIADVINREGNDFQKKTFLGLLTSGQAVTASFCLSENHCGSDAGALKTLATKKGDKYLINGEKIYVTNGAYSDFFLVMARTSLETGSKSISAFLIPRSTAGVVIGREEDKMGLTGSSTIRMSFENVLVPETHRLGPEGDGFKIAMRALDGGRISVSSQALGIAEASLHYGIQYAKEREAFGRPIADFQAIQWKIADAATQLSAAEMLILRAAWMKDQKVAFTREASQAKVFSTEAAIRVCEEMIQILGGYGYIRDYPVERYFRDVRVTALYEGTSEIQRLVIARSLLAA